jgi:hypothetical protein
MEGTKHYNLNDCRLVRNTGTTETSIERTYVADYYIKENCPNNVL